MPKRLRTSPLLAKFRSEEGAITVDWVVLTALLVSLGFVTGTMIWGRTEPVADRVGQYVGSRTVNDQP
ncbi:hypothetical protein [Paenirhodobacter populi]|uniref:Pilus assembly protein n=1 Tax=Paenirhodobacter populi TaxID=2306993 RepID=A0A443K9D7_9RHOB|nr:hypothetical protein [Sinirhodobacter populi]RWR11718.1 hypothetical protein D2T33_10775 [Sinirhodobacter populi]RWR29378.1 hypothetical protein D2T31_10320 [Sinirhodobacter populi]